MTIADKVTYQRFPLSQSSDYGGYDDLCPEGYAVSRLESILGLESRDRVILPLCAPPTGVIHELEEKE